jgi:hypothetical protein
VVVATRSAQNNVLLEHELFRIYAEGRVVWCQVAVPQGTPPTRGAEAAEAMRDLLTREVLVKGSLWLGLVLDVRLGPSVVGPVTLRAVEAFFTAAETCKKPLAVLLGGAPMQRTQYEALCAGCAPRYAQIAADVEAARDWMTAAR